MILIVGSTKGGVGKTTLAFNFAVALAKAGRDVLLVDADTQATASLTTQLRKQELGEVGFTTVALYGESVILQVPQLAKKYQDIIIDVGGRDNPSLRSALLLPDATLLVPVKPRSYDLWGADDTATVVREARARGNTSLRAVMVLNEADHLQEAIMPPPRKIYEQRKVLNLPPFVSSGVKLFPMPARKGLEWWSTRTRKPLMN